MSAFNESIGQLLKDNENIKMSIEEIKGRINSLSLNQQDFIEKNKQPLIPGIGCKFAYDSKGLITGFMDLVASDIPVLQIDHINGLREILNSKIDETTIASIKESIKNINKIGNIVGSGCKVNYDDKGHVVSSSDLNTDDIPTLPIDKIDGLEDIITELRAYHNGISTQHDDTLKVLAGTFAKITFDNKGRVLQGSNLSMTDIPIDLINRLNTMESNMLSFADRKVVDEILQELRSKVNSNPAISPGSYTKVVVDSKGLITKGGLLMREDLPDIYIEDVMGLEKELQSKALYSDYIELNNTVSSIVNSMNQLGDVIALKNKIESKAENVNLINLQKDVDGLHQLMELLNEKIPNDTILEQLSNIQLELSNISGRLSVLEDKFNQSK